MAMLALAATLTGQVPPSSTVASTARRTRWETSDGALVVLTAQDPKTSHVRPAAPLVRSLIEWGLARSETFRRLVNTLNQSDVVVYIDPKITRQTLGAYLSHSVVSAGGRRYLHIFIELHGGDIRLVSLLAHELQHAVEVSQDPDARDSEQVARLFARLASTRGCGISNCEETETALDVQAAVDAELKAAR